MTHSAAKIMIALAMVLTLHSIALGQEQAVAKRQPYRIMVSGNPSDTTADGREHELIRSKIMSSLSRQCGSVCVLVDTGLAEDADHDPKVDAILTGSWQMVTPCWDCAARMQGAMRLVSNDGTVLWSDTVYSNRFTRSITSSFADNVAKRLVSHLKAKPVAAAEE